MNGETSRPPRVTIVPDLDRLTYAQQRRSTCLAVSVALLPTAPVLVQIEVARWLAVGRVDQS